MCPTAPSAQISHGVQTAVLDGASDEWAVLKYLDPPPDIDSVDVCAEGGVSGGERAAGGRGVQKK